MHREARGGIVLLAAVLVVVAVGVRVFPARSEPLWLDEVVSARIISEPNVSSMMGQVRRTESSPPGWHLLNWVVWRTVGEPRIEDLRLLSVVFGALLAALTFWYSSLLGLSRLAAFLAGVSLRSVRMWSRMGRNFGRMRC